MSFPSALTLRQLVSLPNDHCQRAYIDQVTTMVFFLVSTRCSSVDCVGIPLRISSILANFIVLERDFSAARARALFSVRVRFLSVLALGLSSLALSLTGAHTTPRPSFTRSLPQTLAHCFPYKPPHPQPVGSGPRPHAPKDERSGVGERPTPDAPHTGKRRPPPGRPRAASTASKASLQERALWGAPRGGTQPQAGQG